MAEDFDEGAVARGAGIGDDDAKERTLLGTGTTQTNGDHLTLLSSRQAAVAVVPTVWRRNSHPAACYAAPASACDC